MNEKCKVLIKNFTYTFGSNLLVLIISTLVTLILPKILGVREYGYWQLYILYTSYIALLHLGWNDGIYLRYGGKEYDELDKKLFFSQFWMITIFEFIITIISTNLIMFMTNNADKLFIIRMTFVCAVIVIPRGMLLFILQATNKIKGYAITTIVEKLVYVILIIIFLIIGINEYKLLIMSDIIGKIVSLLYVVILCKDIVLRNYKDFFFSFKEAIENINVGVKVALAYVASSLIIGMVRLGIERTWDIETFGKVSLTLSISNMMMIFINAIGLVIYPILKRIDEKKLSDIYIVFRIIITVILLGIIMLYYPVRDILTLWLPKYKESLQYMALIFPMCLFEGKMSLLLNTYLKALRKEKALMKINFITLIISIIITIITTFYMKNLPIAIFSILFLLAFRCIFAEIYISKTLGISLKSDIIIEIILCGIFVISSWSIESWQGSIIYLVGYLIYIIFNRNNIYNMIAKIRTIVT